MALPIRYSPLNWYWIVAGSTTQVWSSARLSLVAVSDTTYVAWVVANTPTKISSAGQLAQVMFGQVEDYKRSTGVAVTSTATPAINATYSAADNALNRLALITSLIVNGKGLPGGAGTFAYPDVNGNNHTFTSGNILNLAQGLQNWVYNWEQAIISRVGGGTTAVPTTITIA